MENLWPRRYRPCSSMTSMAARPRARPVRAGRHRGRDRPERRARQGVAGCAGPVRGCCPPGRRHCPQANSRQPPRPSGESKHDRGSRVGQGTRHRGKRPRPDADRPSCQVQGRYRPAKLRRLRPLEVVGILLTCRDEGLAMRAFQPVAQTARLHRGRPGAWDQGLCCRISFARSVISRC